MTFPTGRASLNKSAGPMTTLLGALLLAAAGAPPARAQQFRANPSEVRVDAMLVGDWASPDLVVVGRQDLWQPAVDRLLAALEPLPVIVISPSESSHESAWVRDFGPIAVARGDRVLWLDAEYYASRPVDDALPRTLGRSLGVPVVPFPHRLEGGGIVTDGRGLCVMTETSLRAMTTVRGTDSMPRSMTKRLGCPTLVVVPALPGEPTGHVDQMIQFLAPGVAAVAELRGENLPPGDVARMDAAAARLAAAARAAGHELRIVRIPVYRHPTGRYMSYVNVIALRGHLLVPDFASVPPDLQSEAYDLLRGETGAELVPIPADDIALGGGGLHCIVLGLHLPPTR
ncbi:MAG: agmatine deiminase family protein [Gemmatimonadota bacterium]